MTKIKFLIEKKEEDKEKAHKKYKLIAPFLEGCSSLKSISELEKIPIRTLNSWIKKYKEHGLKGLVRRTRTDQGKTRSYNDYLRNVIEGLYLNNSNMNKATIHRLVLKYCAYKNLPEPSYKFVCRTIANIPKDMICLATEGSAAYQQKYDLLHIRSSESPNEIWQADHVLLDIKINNSKGSIEQPWLTIVMDDCSRAICGYELSFLAPSAVKTSLCLRHALWRKADPKWGIMGIPEFFYTDHGSDFTSNHIEQVCIDLKIRLIHSQVGKPRGRGKIERFFKTIDQKLLSTLKQITTAPNQTHSLSLKSLNELIYNFIIEYNHSNHSDLGRAPAKRWELGGFLPQLVESLEYLDLLLLTEAKKRKVLRDGIRFQGLRYIDSILAGYVGESVLIRYNPSDITSIRVFHNNKFLCQPLCPELSGNNFGIKEIQKARRKRRKELQQKIKNRKSLVDAVIAANRKDLPLQPNEEAFLSKSSKQIGLKIYEID